MHVLLTSHHAPPHIGGVENLVLAKAKALLAAGHRVTAFYLQARQAGAGGPGAGRRMLWCLRSRARACA